jgi:hypothetical protein
MESLAYENVLTSSKLTNPRHCQLHGVSNTDTIEVLGQEPQSEDLTGYPTERAQAHSLRNRVGSEAVYRAYFQGDAKPLRTAVDKALAEKPLAGMQDKIKELPPLE